MYLSGRYRVGMLWVGGGRRWEGGGKEVGRRWEGGRIWEEEKEDKKMI